MRRLTAPLQRMTRPVGGWLGRRSRFQLGVLWLVATLVVGLALMNKQQILLALRRGDTVTAEFSSRYKLRGIVSKVEVAGVRVGTVTGVDELDDGGAAVEMKLDKGTLGLLGSAPEAAIRPATFLGGPGLSVYVELTPGGEPGRFRDGRIPPDRTRVPVEFDRVFEILTEEARAGLSTTVQGLEEALAGGGGEALAATLEHAPPALRPAAGVLDALSGTEEGDLVRLIAHLGRAAAVLTETDGELESVVDDLATVAATLGDRGPELARAIGDMPATLAAARAGLAALDTSLARLEATAPAARPSVQRLSEILRKLPPVLREARPLLADLRPLIADLHPALDDLGPTARLLRDLLADLDDPVLGRLADDIVPALLATNAGAAGDTRLYEELGYFVAGFAGAASYLDSMPSRWNEGSQLNFNIGFTCDSIAGLPVDVECVDETPGAGPHGVRVPQEQGYPGRMMR